MKPALPVISAERQRALRSKVATAVRRDRENDLLLGVDRSRDGRRIRDVGHHSANLHELRVRILRLGQLDLGVAILELHRRVPVGAALGNRRELDRRLVREERLNLLERVYGLYVTIQLAIVEVFGVKLIAMCRFRCGNNQRVIKLYLVTVFDLQSPSDKSD